MTVNELAVYLHLPKSSLYRLLKEGQIPGKKVGKHWRFHKPAVELWLGSVADQHDQAVTVENTEAFFMSGESHDISEHANLFAKFDVRRNQLARGKFHGTVKLVKTPGVIVFEESYQRKAEVQGASPGDYVTLGTNIAAHRSEILWCGKTIDEQRFACGGPGAPIDFLMPNRSHHICILVKPELLAGAIGQHAYDTLVGSQTIDFTATAGQALIKTVTESIREFAKNPERLNNSYIVSSLESRLLETLSTCFTVSNQVDRLRPVSRHQAYVREAIIQAERSDRPLTVMELAVAVGVSRRTLNYAFQNVLDTTPHAFLQTHRLNAVHRELAAADPKESTVTRLALKWGFSHAGRFSLLHRKLFDEMPSETLQRA